MRPGLIHLALFITFALGACGQDRTVSTDPGYESSIHDTPTDVHATLILDTTELDPAQSLSATLTITYPQGVTIEPIEPIDDESDLTLADRTESAITFDGQRFSRTINLTYEPYLPGVFELAPFGARIDRPDQPRRVIRLAPIEVTVTSVLDESDDGQLEAASGTYLPPEPDHTRTETALILAAISMGIACLAIVLFLRRSGAPSSPDQDPDPESTIRRALRSHELDEPRIVEIHNALAQLAKRRAGVVPLLADLERARFGSVPNRDDAIRRAASRAVDFRESRGDQA